MKCVNCGEYFKKTKWNEGPSCESCSDLVYTPDTEAQLELNLLKNPTGRTPPVFYDGRDEDDSFGL